MVIEPDYWNDVQPEPQEECVRDTIAQRIDEGIVVPIIGNALIDDLMLGDHDALVQGWAHYTRYPQLDYHHKLARVAQYTAVHQASDQANDQPGDDARVKERYVEFLKRALQARAKRDPTVSSARCDEVASEASTLTVSEMARRFNYPKINSPDENPLLVLADLPLPVFITTSYHNCLEIALKEMGKEPQVEVFRWREGLESIPSVFDEQLINNRYDPDIDHPLVYHLFGHDRWPASMALTEDDYLDFLTNIFKDGRALPPRVRQAITESSLVMIGYRPRDWDFRALFRGIIAPRPFSTIKTSVAIQVEPSNDSPQEYLEKYMRQARFSVEWCQPGEFIHDIYDRWQNR